MTIKQQELSNLRKIMTKEIEFYGWLDYSYNRGDYEASSFPNYASWLNSLEDSDFLSRYNDVREQTFNLD